MLCEYHIIYSVQYYPQIYVTAADLGTYNPQIQGSTFISDKYLTTIFSVDKTERAITPQCR